MLCLFNDLTDYRLMTLNQSKSEIFVQIVLKKSLVYAAINEDDNTEVRIGKNILLQNKSTKNCF